MADVKKFGVYNEQSSSPSGSPAPPYVERLPSFSHGSSAGESTRSRLTRTASKKRYLWYTLAYIALGSLVALLNSHRSSVQVPGSMGRRRRDGPKTARLVPGPKELLSPLAPSSSLYDGLRPDLRYLIADSWSGLSGQFTSALAQLYLARLTQRIAILPSWEDDLHYGGGNLAKISDFFDMESFRQTTGSLFVELDDVKNRTSPARAPDVVGCFRASQIFVKGASFEYFNIKQSLLDVEVPALWTWSYEAFQLFDMDTTARLNAARRLFKSLPKGLPRNVREESSSKQGGGLLCLNNIWDLQQAGSGIQTSARTSKYGKPEPQYLSSSSMSEYLAPELTGTHPEWWQLGQYMDFKSNIWAIAMDCVHQTLKLSRRQTRLPPLLTVHIRRGDFLGFCGGGENCVPTLNVYGVAVEDLLADLPKETLVLVTTDETEDLEFLHQIDQLGWYRIDHAALGTADKLRSEFDNKWRWADAAVDQAILSLGSAFVGTHGSQVSQLSALRVEAWNEGQTSTVGAP